MRQYANGLIGASFLVLAVCFLCAMSCSWDIITKGEILKGSETSLEDLEAYEANPLHGVGDLEMINDIPDSIYFKIRSVIEINGETYDFVEMEVGELLDGQGGERDTIEVNHVP